jgi:hypothetical protein
LWVSSQSASTSTAAGDGAKRLGQAKAPERRCLPPAQGSHDDGPDKPPQERLSPEEYVLRFVRVSADIIKTAGYRLQVR